MSRATTKYFNAASHGVSAADVYDVMARYLRDEAALGPELAADKWAEPVAAVRASAAMLVGGTPDQIGFFSTTTTAWQAMLARMDLAGKRVLVAPHEWGEYYSALGLRGDVTVEVLPELDTANPDLSSWSARMGDDVGALFVPMVTSITGLRYPVEAIGEMPRAKGCKYIVDGAQALGQMNVDVGKIGCDALYSTTRKWLRGPRQTALIWLAESWDVCGRDLEAADQNLALRLGLGAAIDAVLEAGIDTVQAGILARSDQIREWAVEQGLAVAAGTTGSVSIRVADADVMQVNAALKAHGIHAKIPKAVHFEPVSGVGAQDCHVLRLSPHVYTTQADMEQMFKAVLAGFAR